jgi:hypothetical protein
MIEDYVSVIQTQQKGLFIGDVLRIVERKEHEFVCIDLLEKQSHVLTKNQFQQATSDDIYLTFIKLTGGWVAHKFKEKIDYISRVKKIELPYLHHSTGSDMLWNFIPATNDVILEQRINEVNLDGIIEGAKVQDDMEIEGYVKGFKLDMVTKELIVKFVGDSKIEYERPLSHLKILDKGVNMSKVFNRGEFVFVKGHKIKPTGFIVQVTKTDLNAFYNEDLQEWFYIDKLPEVRRVTEAEKLKVLEFNGKEFANILIQQIKDKLVRNPVNEYNTVEWRIFISSIIAGVQKVMHK